VNVDPIHTAGEFIQLNEAWFNLVSDSLGAGRSIHWSGFDTLLVIAEGGNPVGLEHICADIRHQLENELPAAEQYKGLSMAYVIKTYPFDESSPTRLLDSLAAELFNEVGSHLQQMEH
jgi:hypothetical protein